MGTERGLQAMLATTASHFDGGFQRNGFAWVTCGWEMSLVESRKIYGYSGRNGMDGLHLWLTEGRKRWPDAKLITQGELGELWRAQFKSNDKLDYQFVHRGCGIRASAAGQKIRWFSRLGCHSPREGIVEGTSAVIRVIGAEASVLHHTPNPTSKCRLDFTN
jgi:hypothetical protein